MAFNEGIPVPPISLRANLLDGGLAADQVTPTTSVMGYRLKLVGSSHLCRVHNGGRHRGQGGGRFAHSLQR